jgi:cytidine deaminase
MGNYGEKSHEWETMLSEKEQIELWRAAREAMGKAYAPYSRIRVGAALLAGTGNYYTGVNVENASLGLTVCAERVAVFQAVAAEGPKLSIKALAVVSDAQKPFPPCGACRQVILEFGSEALVLFEGKDGPAQLRAAELLPHVFHL